MSTRLVFVKRETPVVSPARRKATPLLLAMALPLALAGCSDRLDFDLRNNFGNGFDTSGAVRQVTAPRPQPDTRGVISYPNYQVVVAGRGDTLGDVAARIGVDADTLARYNGIATDVPLRQGEILALPGRVAEPSPATGALTTGPIRPAGQIDVEELAGNAINAAPETAPRTATEPRRQTGAEPVRHKVERGETAYSIARLYNVSVRSLAQWNGLGPDLNVREGQYLLIPVAAEQAPRTSDNSAPGQGTPTPLPPSASQPLPENDTTARSEATETAPQSPNLNEERSSSGGRLRMPVDGRIIRPFAEGRSGGIDISARAGAPVVAADAGTVAAITQDTNQVPVLVLRHAGNLLTVYANITDITVAKGDRVTRGQPIAKVNAGANSFIRFEVRRGFESVDPMEFLN